MNHIPVYYSPRQVAYPNAFSPSASKPAEVVADWLKTGLPIEVREPEPATRETLALAHTREYVDAILECRARNGFGESSHAVADSLPWTSGSFLSAAREALANQRVAASPTSGFHHAGRDRASGFCTFNGLTVAALQLKAENRVQRVAILDSDYHYGDGTEDIIAALKIDWIRHVTGYSDEANVPRYLANLADVVRRFADCDLLLYQAGADPHVDDPLGGFLTTEQLAERDRIVFSMARRIGLPVVWNLAGGYQDPFENVLEIHRNTMAAARDAFVDVQAASTPIRLHEKQR